MENFCRFENYDDMIRQLQRMRNNTETVCRNTISDFQKRAPSWVAKEVTRVYTINKQEVRSTRTQSGRAIGGIRFSGRTIGSCSIVYTGRALSPTYFKMTPKMPNGSGYTLKVEILKGKKETWGKIKKLGKKQRKNIGKNFTRQGTQNSPTSPKMLLSTGNRQENGTNYIPFQRVSQDRNDIKAIKTVSLPQMVDNPQVRQNIDATIQTQMSQRLEHHMGRYGIR